MHCVSIEPNGYFIDLVVEHDGFFEKVHQSELSIPAHFVLYIVSAHPNKILGFSASESAKNKVDTNIH